MFLINLLSTSLKIFKSFHIKTKDHFLAKLRILIKNKDPGYILSINSKGINKKPISLPVNTNVVQIQEFLNDKIKNKKLRCIPLIDRLGRIVD